MTDFKVGDRVILTRGEGETAERVSASVVVVGGPINHLSHWLRLEGVPGNPPEKSVRDWEDSGWTITRVSPPAPELPTEPGAVILWHSRFFDGVAVLEKENQWLYMGNNWTDAEMRKEIGEYEVTRLYTLDQALPLNAETIAAWLGAPPQSWSTPARAIRNEFLKESR